MDNSQLGHESHRPSDFKYPICLLAHDIVSPMNIGSLFRAADALGVEKIYLTGASPVPPNSKIRRTSRATDKVVPYHYSARPLPVIAQLKSEGYRIISLELTSASSDIRQRVVPAGEKLCLILGAESGGIDQALLDASDLTVHIPMLGRNSSMNVAVACAIAVFELSRDVAVT